MNRLSLVHAASLHVTVSSKFVQYSVQTGSGDQTGDEPHK